MLGFFIFRGEILGFILLYKKRGINCLVSIIL